MIKAIFDTVLETWDISIVGDIASNCIDIELRLVANGVLPVSASNLVIKISDCKDIRGFSEVGCPVLVTNRIKLIPNTTKTINFDCNGKLASITFDVPKPVLSEEDAPNYVWDDSRHKYMPSPEYKIKLESKQLLSISDAKMARAFEDLVSLLGCEENLPQIVKDNLANRRELRSKIAGNI